MNKLMMIFLLSICLLLSACTHSTANFASSQRHAQQSLYQVRFQLPLMQRWKSQGIEQDRRGYVQSWLPTVKGPAAEQSLYVNFGRDIKIAPMATMQDVKMAMRHDCRKASSHVIKKERAMIVFEISASECIGGHPVWQLFHVFNKEDGQYAIVYSSNPQTVPVSVRQQMAKTVMNAHLERAHSVGKQ